MFDEWAGLRPPVAQPGLGQGSPTEGACAPCAPWAPRAPTYGSRLGLGHSALLDLGQAAPLADSKVGTIATYTHPLTTPALFRGEKVWKVLFVGWVGVEMLFNEVF